MLGSCHGDRQSCPVSEATLLVQVVSELDEVFVPQPDDLIVNLQESRAVVETLLDTLPQNFAQNLSSESAMGPALQGAFLAMSALGGKLLLFQAAVPSLGGFPNTR